jgi:hypothetical protein
MQDPGKSALQYPCHHPLSEEALPLTDRYQKGL